MPVSAATIYRTAGISAALMRVGNENIDVCGCVPLSYLRAPSAGGLVACCPEWPASLGEELRRNLTTSRAGDRLNLDIRTFGDIHAPAAPRY